MFIVFRPLFGLAASLSLLFVASATTQASQDHASIKKIADSLTERLNQPTFQEMLDAFGGKFPDHNPFLNEKLKSAQYEHQSLYKPNYNGSFDTPTFPAEQIAAYIAKIELLYPGATWAFLGNDTRLIADPVEAFYLSIKQRDRVVPLHGSGSTIRIDDMELLAKFLDSAGFDAKNPLDRPPFIIIDRTAYWQSSQIRHLLKAGYQAYVKNGGNPLDLLTKLNALNINGPTELTPIATVRSNYLDSQLKHLKDFPDPFNKDVYSGIPKEIIALGANPFQSRPFWHSGHGPIIQDENGRWIGSPSISFEATTRYILAFAFELYREIAQPRFLELVQSEALKLGYEFPLQRPNVGEVYQSELTPVKLPSPKQKLMKDVMNHLKPLDAKFTNEVFVHFVSSCQTKNGQELKLWIEANAFGKLKTKTLLMFLEEISKALDKRIISWDDYRILVVTTIGLHAIDSTAFLPKLKTLIKTIPALYQVFTDDRVPNQTQWLNKFSHYYTTPETSDLISHIIEEVVRPYSCEKDLTAEL